MKFRKPADHQIQTLKPSLSPKIESDEEYKETKPEGYRQKPPRKEKTKKRKSSRISNCLSGRWTLGEHLKFLRGKHLSSNLQD